MIHLLNDTDRGQAKYTKNRCPCHFVHHKCHMDWPVNEPDVSGKKPVAKSLRHGTTFRDV
jgi:hypothetical protein